MKEEFFDLPGWLFEIEEVSMNVYKVKGRNCIGNEISKMGVDVDLLITECKKEAKMMEQRIVPFEE